MKINVKRVLASAGALAQGKAMKINAKRVLAVTVAALALGFLSLVYANRQESLARQNRVTYAAEARTSPKAPGAPWYAFWR